MPQSDSSHRHLASLGQWIHQTLHPQAGQVKFRLRGNSLHILYQQMPCPDRQQTFVHLVAALRRQDINRLLPVGYPSIYQVVVYGSEPRQAQPAWTTPIYLSQLDRHWEQIRHLAAQAKLATAAQRERRAASGTTASGTAASGTAASGTTASGTATRQPASSAASLSPTAAQSSGESHPETTALALSSRSLAKQGKAIAIAAYLSETLGNLGVSVRVNAKTIAYASQLHVGGDRVVTPLAAPLVNKRLWIACEAVYSPDPALVSEPIAQQLRELEIEGYRDAVIVFQVAGEVKPDWIFRVDLTPPTAMLREWGRWGDLESLQRLLNRALEPAKTQIQTIALKETTLHICCVPIADASSAIGANASAALNPAPIKAIVADVLEALAPQGIHAAALYGQALDHQTPAWVDWLTLPATQHPALAELPLSLAQQGDWDAIAFLLHRLLNANLDRYLATGGIRLQLLPKRDLLHIMSEAPLCPDQQISKTIVRFLKPLNLDNLTGVRIYGRRAGQKAPLWSYGTDFIKRDRLVPEAAPEFAASDAYLGELLASTALDALAEPALKGGKTASQRDRWLQRLQQSLIRSQLFVPNSNTVTALALSNGASNSASSGETRWQSAKVAMVWGALGALLTFQLNWLLQQGLRSQPKAPDSAAIGTVPTAVASSQLPAIDAPASPSPAASSPAASSPAAPASPTNSPFNATGFTQSPASEPAAPAPDLPHIPRSDTAIALASEIVAQSPPLPTFNSSQFDQKLQLYYHLLAESGPPDVLIVGSSRALRGVDPIALREGLEKLGYTDPQVFNFGVNGATAQVVDLLLRQVLLPDQLPKLVLWADGARAFNSGNTDVTYNGMAASVAYQQLVAGSFPRPAGSAAIAASTETPSLSNLNTALNQSYQSLDRWLSQQLGQWSGSFEQRDRLKQWFQSGVAVVAPIPAETPSTTALQATLNADQGLVDPEGFLSLAVQFNPATYYQKYARVTGQYDSDYENFQIVGRQASALQAVIKLGQTHQVPIAFVNLPLTDQYLDPFRRQQEQVFREFMIKQSMEQAGFSFHDLGEVWPQQYRYFSDPSHLNRYGAFAVADRLVNDPLMPWQPNP